jgi:RAB protein geranylgeranyltransferase component A
MESISTIDMMEMYGEAFSEVTLEELEKYINKNHK